MWLELRTVAEHTPWWLVLRTHMRVEHKLWSLGLHMLLWLELHMRWLHTEEQPPWSTKA